MKINAILPTFNSTLKYQKAAHVSAEKNQQVYAGNEYIFATSFQGSRAIILSPSIKDSTNKELYEKILALIKGFPRGAENKDKIFLRKIGDNFIGIKLNTNNPELTKVEIKNMIEKSEDWNVSKNGQASAIFYVRPDGMMMEGEYSTKNQNSQHIDTIKFNRFSTRGRHLGIMGKTFSPSRGCPDIWYHKGHSGPKSDPDMTFELATQIKKSPFSEIFTELTKPNVVLK